MTVAVAVLGVIVAVLAVFVIALLRSHAELLRRLAGLEEVVDAAPAGAFVPGSDAASAGRGGLPAATLPGRRPGGRAHPIIGETLGGEPVSLGVEAPGRAPTLLAFLGTSCASCAPLWEELHHGPVPTPLGAQVVVVTKGPERERLARLLELAPDGADVVMSTSAWEAYAVPSTPHFVLVRDGVIAGRGAATSWAQITGFLTDAADDDAIHAARGLSTEARAARAERALADAGIGPGHPSLYPTAHPAGDADLEPDPNGATNV